MIAMIAVLLVPKTIRPLPRYTKTTEIIIITHRVLAAVCILFRPEREEAHCLPAKGWESAAKAKTIIKIAA